MEQNNNIVNILLESVSIFLEQINLISSRGKNEVLIVLFLI
jgi:hypothetical protein